MPDLEALRDLTPQFPPPSLDDLAAVVRRRRRRAALTAGAGALAVAAVVVVATLIGGMPSNDRSMDPVDDPTDGRTDRTAEDLSWAPDQIRAEGDTEGTMNFSQGRGGALEARFWSVCERVDCDYDAMRTGDNYDYRVIHSALEVTVNGYRTSGVFGLNQGPGEFPEIHLQYFDDDTIYVQDWDRQGGTQWRYRLLNADGTTTDLTMLPSAAPPAPGPDVVRTSFLVGGRAPVGDSFEFAGLALVDDTAGTIQRLDLPDAVFTWADSAADELLWGVGEDGGCVAYWQQPAGEFAHRELDCRSSSPVLQIAGDDFLPATWFTAERMAVIELGGSKFSPVALHVSLDRGDTWQRIPVTEDTMNDVLEQLG
jgi:hypothetical protein